MVEHARAVAGLTFRSEGNAADTGTALNEDKHNATARSEELGVKGVLHRAVQGVRASGRERIHARESVMVCLGRRLSAAEHPRAGARRDALA
eukprot:6185639-Pleurochrysis_carterae.AAC.3